MNLRSKMQNIQNNAYSNQFPPKYKDNHVNFDNRPYIQVCEDKVSI